MMFEHLHSRPTGLTLFVDADDTLWENNVYFEEVIQEYCRLAAARGVGEARARETLLAIERVRTKIDGYGITNFARSLAEACHQLLGDDRAQEVRAIHRLCQRIRERDMQLLPGVGATLEELSARHRVILLTKGDPDDQRDKIARSGLQPFMHDVEIVREKDTATYLQAMVRFEVDPELGWMIGNSPRSDVLPALAAGLGVVYIPHPMTWVLEMEVLPAPLPQRFVQLERFDELTRIF
jgi:putative hydrolase of the HAD superfamily